MGLLEPLNLLLGLSLAALVAIYLRARARPTITVSSLELFAEAAAPVARSRTLRVDALFWLEAAALTALTLAAAGFYLREPKPASRVVREALVFDLGAAMNARESDTSRLDAARQAALALIDSAPAGREFSVIGYALDAQLIRAAAGRGAELRSAILALTPVAVAPRPAALSAALIDANGAAKIDLFTDHQPAPELLRDARAHAAVAIHLIGGPVENLALVSLDPGTPKSSQGHALIRNFSARAQPCELVIDAAGREVFHSTLILDPRAAAMVGFGPLAQGGMVRARIMTADGLSADNERYALAPSVAPARALVVSPDNATRDDLARILLAVNPAYRVTVVDTTPAALSSLAGQKFDLAVIHDFSGAAIDAAARFVIFPPPANGESGRVVGSSIAQAELRGRAGAPPLATPVTLGPTRALALPAWMEPLALGGVAGDPSSFVLAGIGRTPGGSNAVIGFDVRNHLLLDPDRLDALLLTIDTLRLLAAPTDARVVATGDFVPVATFAPATLLTPSGARSQLIPDRSGRVRFRAVEAGRYALQSGKKTTTIYANYYDAGESDLAMAPGADTPAAHMAHMIEAAGMHRESQVVQQTTPLAALVILLLLLESVLLARRSARWGVSHV
ncbi:MAG TPA: hypothetical protein VKS22_16565 [Candidatus Binataceae bacterium]|nr:hypothetical protein [Candidatus Binataceae bacterium]